MLLCGWGRIQRISHGLNSEAEQLYSLLQPAWNGGSWCEQYFGRLHIHPLSADGFAPAFTPDEGFNRGDNYSGEKYQASRLPVSGVLPTGDSIRLPRTPDGMPVNNLVFSDDRRLLDPTIDGLTALTDACVVATRNKGGLVHPSKLMFYKVVLIDSSISLAGAAVPAYQTATAPSPPLVVGIPVFHQVPPLDEYH